MIHVRDNPRERCTIEYIMGVLSVTLLLRNSPVLSKTWSSFWTSPYGPYSVLEREITRVMEHTFTPGLSLKSHSFFRCFICNFLGFPPS